MMLATLSTFALRRPATMRFDTCRRRALSHAPQSRHVPCAAQAQALDRLASLIMQPGLCVHRAQHRPCCRGCEACSARWAAPRVGSGSRSHTPKKHVKAGNRHDSGPHRRKQPLLAAPCSEPLRPHTKQPHGPDEPAGLARGTMEAGHGMPASESQPRTQKNCISAAQQPPGTQFTASPPVHLWRTLRHPSRAHHR